MSVFCFFFFLKKRYPTYFNVGDTMKLIFIYSLKNIPTVLEGSVSFGEKAYAQHHLLEFWGNISGLKSHFGLISTLSYNKVAGVSQYNVYICFILV